MELDNPMDLPFELDSSVIEGLKLLNHKIDEEITRKLIVNTVKQLLAEGSGMHPLTQLIAC